VNLMTLDLAHAVQDDRLRAAERARRARRARQVTADPPPGRGDTAPAAPLRRPWLARLSLVRG
jgi:hypothetical protein